MIRVQPSPDQPLSRQLRQLANVFAEFGQTGIQMAGPVATAHARALAELAEKAAAMECGRQPTPGLGASKPPRPLPLHSRGASHLTSPKET